MGIAEGPIGDDEFERAAQSTDFIQEYIFPGSCIPSRARIEDSIESVTDLRPTRALDLRLDYARTLHEWRRRFLDRLAAVRALGFDDRFIRMWNFYLCYCEAGFLEDRIGNWQLYFSKPQHALKGGSDS